MPGNALKYLKVDYFIRPLGREDTPLKSDDDLIFSHFSLFTLYFTLEARI
jgi:hypothetical protein